MWSQNSSHYEGMTLFMKKTVFVKLLSNILLIKQINKLSPYWKENYLSKSVWNFYFSVSNLFPCETGHSKKRFAGTWYYPLWTDWMVKCGCYIPELSQALWVEKVRVCDVNQMQSHFSGLGKLLHLRKDYKDSLVMFSLECRANESCTIKRGMHIRKGNRVNFDFMLSLKIFWYSYDEIAKLCQPVSYL